MIRVFQLFVLTSILICVLIVKYVKIERNYEQASTEVCKSYKLYLKYNTIWGKDFKEDALYWKDKIRNYCGNRKGK